jgi:hypothetical protein
MAGHIKVNGVTSLMAKHNKYEQQAKVHGAHYKEIYRHQLLNVVLKKSAPRL